ncbi:MAG TPA: hypothetical protein VEZ72_17420 [Paenibacillus sp.]|nr:hypothetical protein [Paenibacillus sp.]
MQALLRRRDIFQGKEGFRRTLLTGIDWSFLLFLGVAFGFAAAANALGVVDALTGALGEGMAAFVASPALFPGAVVLLSFAVTLVAAG